MSESIPPSTAGEPRSLWVDDTKPCPSGFDLARTYDEALTMLRLTDYDELYLDYDLGAPGCNGRNLLLELAPENRIPLRVRCISNSPAGRELIQETLKQIRSSANV